VATDIEDHSRWDWPVRTREAGPVELAQIAGHQKGLGFEIAKEALGSSVERVERSVYDLDPAHDGHFEVVVCGALLLHLRDPVRALEAIRSVCTGSFVSAEQVDVRLTMLSRRRPAASFRGGDRVQWWIPNAAAHRALLESAGFRIVGKRRYRVPLGAGHPARRRRTMPYSALLAEPDV
jgi:tRNA (mo5U34)-methyltransferase